MRRASNPVLVTAALGLLTLTGCATVDDKPNGSAASDAGRPSGPPAGADPFKDLPQGTPVAFKDLKTGMCSNHRDDVQADQSIGVVDCTTPHFLEVVSQVTLSAEASAAFPGDRGVMDLMRTACEPTLAPMIGSRRGELISVYLAPMNQKSWDAGNRLGQCAIGYAVPRSGTFAQAGGQG
ncbi:septum formation family protein [Streptomyces sp. BR123]|uniref:septum formation family protein n=1 Tax=Streptomyces sp. BR123 TaxID=2749828 RepID=UPI0015C4A16F|nr:septum formation family protein [Streptomyces sp. BR123]NXY94901.1 septum formation family protein [Streptomyces sp. BR123]